MGRVVLFVFESSMVCCADGKTESVDLETDVILLTETMN